MHYFHEKKKKKNNYKYQWVIRLNSLILVYIAEESKKKKKIYVKKRRRRRRYFIIRSSVKRTFRANISNPVAQVKLEQSPWESWTFPMGATFKNRKIFTRYKTFNREQWHSSGPRQKRATSIINNFCIFSG